MKDDSNMSGSLSNWSSVAFNQVPNSDNRIHSDEVAKEYGFKGGLVPGVTLSAYLVHPAVQAWGRDWLQKGCAHVKVVSPVYEGDTFLVELVGESEAYSARLMREGQCCANAEVFLPRDASPAPKMANHPLMEASYSPPPATRECMETFKQEGCPAMKFCWQAAHEMARYIRDMAAMPTLLRTDLEDLSASAKANLSFLLGCANRHFAGVAHMSPWVHVETKSQNFQIVELNTHLVSEMTIVDLFEKKGHEFADCQVNLFDENTGDCVCTIWQRAIYRLRGAD